MGGFGILDPSRIRYDAYCGSFLASMGDGLLELRPHVGSLFSESVRASTHPAAAALCKMYDRGSAICEVKQPGFTCPTSNIVSHWSSLVEEDSLSLENFQELTQQDFTAFVLK